MRIVRCHEHYNVVDNCGRFLCSADTAEEAMRDIEKFQNTPLDMGANNAYHIGGE